MLRIKSVLWLGESDMEMVCIEPRSGDICALSDLRLSLNSIHDSKVFSMRLLMFSVPLFACVSSLADERVDFSRDIRPIFNEQCIACHGGVKQAGGISFVYRDQVLGAAKSGKTPVVPGDLAASELIYRVSTGNEEDRMPPVEEHPAGLSPDEIDTLKKWVLQGARWGEHWAFVKPVPQPLPAPRDSSWVRNGIDQLVLGRLEKEGIVPAPDAPPERWLRRVSLDLTGLPPNPKERREFLADAQGRGEEAYPDAVDRLLASPQFGERWASVWLDQVRYADSKGLGQDGRRTIWKYRDWVIDAFNSDLPYDQFTLKQVAGDLLPNPGIADLIATAAHRTTQSSEEGGTDDEEFRIAAVLDRVNTTWQTWQGITFGCVQCHNHPYDPFRHDEYYKFAAFFNNTADCDLDEEWPVLQAPLAKDDYAKAGELDRTIRDIRETIWKEEYAPLAETRNWRPLKNLQLSSSTATEIAAETVADHEEFYTVNTVAKETAITIEAPLLNEVKRLTAIRFTGMPLNPKTAIPDSEWGFVLSHVTAELVVPGEQGSRPIALAHVWGDEPDPFFDPDDSLNSRSSQGFSAYTRIHYPRQAALIPESPVDIPAGSRLRVKLEHRRIALGAFPLVTRRGHLAVSDEPVFSDLLSNKQLRQWKEQLAGLQKRRQEIRSAPVPVLKERPERLARPTHVFIRGLFLTKDKLVTSNVPELFPPLPDGLGKDRLALARWLVSSENPLTARVAVNRFWARLFGIGLVATEEDFGSSGEPPSNPALLDYLALRFQNENAWSVKEALKEMVLSRTYRQSSKVRSELLERDPENRLLAMGPRHRLPAEIIRDQALAIGGLLSQAQFGPPSYPPIPDGVWAPFQASDKWRTAKPGDGDRYRRSIYTYTKRTIPYPMYAAFDAPSREFCTPRRMRSNTPLQALMTLNDETFAECAKGLAERMAEEPEASIREKLAAGYRIATSRDPGADTLGELNSLFATVKERYQFQPEQTQALADTPENAAFRVVASVLLNLDEVLTK